MANSLGFSFKSGTVKCLIVDNQKKYFGFYKEDDINYATPLLNSENEVKQWAKENAVSLLKSGY